MRTRFTLGVIAAAAVAIGISGSALAGAQREEPTDETPSEVVVRPGRIGQSPFKLGSSTQISVPGDGTVADAALIGERLVVAVSGPSGSRLLMSPDGKTWDAIELGPLIGAGDLQLIAGAELQQTSEVGLLAAGSAPSFDKALSEQLVVAESVDLVDTAVEFFPFDPPTAIADATWTVEVDRIAAHAAGYLVSGTLIADEKSIATIDPADAAARTAAERGVPFSLGGSSVTDLTPVSGIDLTAGRTSIRTSVGTDNGLISFGTDDAGYPTAWTSTDAKAWTEAIPVGLTDSDAILDADSTGTNVSLAGVNINGPMVWTSTDGGASFTAAILAQTPEDSFDVFAEQVVITDSGTLVLASRRAPVISEGPTALRDSFIETLAWLVSPTGTVSRATGTELFGTDGMVLEASADGGQVTVLLEDADGSTRLVLAAL